MVTLPDIPSAPPEWRLYIIGDIHGRLDLLARLCGGIEKDAARYPHRKKELIFLGDYVDRGVNTKGVIDFLLTQLPPDFALTFLCGNHDESFRRFLDGESELLQGWMLLGGSATLASYGVNPFRAGASENPDDVRTELLEKMPPDHKVFLDNLELAAVRGDYYFVHAGVRPGVPLERQKPEDQMWIRQVFLTATDDFGKVIVHGHTITPKVTVKRNRIGIDTGAYATGHLSCLVLQDTLRELLST